MLAAGAGSRFGAGGGKLLAEWRGRALIDHVLETIVAARTGGILAGGVVVHGDGGDAIRDLAGQHGFDAVHAPRAGAGISESLKAGLVALRISNTPKMTTAALLCLGDQPLLSLDVIAALVTAAAGSDARLIRPRYSEAPDQPGHPVLIGRAHWHLVAETVGDRGLDPIVRAHGLAWREVNVTGSNPDVDTPDDLTALP